MINEVDSSGKGAIGNFVINKNISIDSKNRNLKKHIKYNFKLYLKKETFK